MFSTEVVAEPALSTGAAAGGSGLSTGWAGVGPKQVCLQAACSIKCPPPAAPVYKGSLPRNF